MRKIEKSCKTCKWYKTLFGAEYCARDIKLEWEAPKEHNKYEMICDRYLSKKASCEEQVQYLRNHYEKQIEVEEWNNEEEEVDEFMREKCSPYEIFKIKQYIKKSIAKRSKFIDKYPALNPSPPSK